MDGNPELWGTTLWDKHMETIAEQDRDMHTLEEFRLEKRRQLDIEVRRHCIIPLVGSH